MYGVAGERRLAEWEVPWLPGYETRRRCAWATARTHSCSSTCTAKSWTRFTRRATAGLAPTETAWALQRKLLEHLETIWEQPDYGIWEVRGPPQHFTHSKIMAWVAFDRAHQGRGTLTA